MDRSEGYHWAKIFVSLIVLAFQVVVLYSANLRYSYLLSNMSIIAGYILDLFVVKEAYKKEKIFCYLSDIFIAADFISLFLSFVFIFITFEIPNLENPNFNLSFLFFLFNERFVIVTSLVAIGIQVFLNIITLIYIKIKNNSFSSKGD